MNGSGWWKHHSAGRCSYQNCTFTGGFGLTQLSDYSFGFSGPSWPSSLGLLAFPFVGFDLICWTFIQTCTGFLFPSGFYLYYLWALFLDILLQFSFELLFLNILLVFRFWCSFINKSWLIKQNDKEPFIGPYVGVYLGRNLQWNQ